ncbi:vWA domain-containing protein [Naumannella cuiyingiana]|uniref:Ca-activated chloride channel family protein n=1 Tax=Naumannella cuiyingiana TaxID=1347891 RepID=A0A7Z0D729_9ACTN|nr:VWA domain-containing protein [Naumannella cuiyingiana]NYI70065.1 Ca-activated chloride channel family protein [Naumannella cuiyingiana]
MRIRHLIALAASLGLMLTWLVAGPAALSRADVPDGRLLMVLDSSGSMNEPAGDDRSKIDAAKTALTSVADSLPADAQVGMRVYGATVFSADDPGACEDSQLVVPIGTGNAAALKAEIAKYKPFGETPMAYALEQAAKDLGGEGRRSILLVSDGEETCAPDPCKVAQQIADRGIDLRIDVVGFQVSGQAREQLECIADKGRGGYYDAADTEQLTQSLNEAKDQALNPFEVTGTPVEGTPDSAAAPPLTTGRWVDKLGAPGQARHYRLTRTVEGSSFWVGASMQPPSSSDAQVSLRLSPLGQPSLSCGDDIASRITASFSRTLLTGVANSWLPPDSTKTDCLTGDLVLSVTPAEAYDPLEGQPIQINVVEEPPLAADAAIPQPPADPTWQPVPLGQPIDRQGEFSFDTAPLIDPGTYRFTISPGDVQLFRVPAGWGQRIQATVLMPPATGDGYGSSFKLRVLSPLGGDASVDAAESPNSSSDSTSTGTESAASVSTYPIAYRNRELPTEARTSAALPGEYLIAVTYDEGDGETMTATLQADVIGDDAQVPDYQGDPPDVRGPGNDRGLLGGRPWPLIIGLAGGAAALVAIGGGALWLLRRG